MTKRTKILLGAGGGILGVLGLVAAWVLLQLIALGRPTEGPTIATYPQPRAALVIIDVQEDFTGPRARWPYADGDRLVNAANGLIDRATAAGLEVVYVQNRYDDPSLLLRLHDMNLPGQPGTELDARLKRANDHVFPKDRGDAFANPDLQAFLAGRQVDRLFLAGLDAAHCVSSTAQGALNRGYRVSVVRDAVITATGRPLDDILAPLVQAGAQVVDAASFPGH